MGVNGECLVINVEIFDMMGRSVLRHCEQSEAIQTIDISELPAGVYFAKIHTEKGTVTQKFIKN